MAIEDLKKSKILQGKDAINKLRGSNSLVDAYRRALGATDTSPATEQKSVPQRILERGVQVQRDIQRVFPSFNLPQAFVQGIKPRTTDVPLGLGKPLEALPEPVKQFGQEFTGSFANIPRNISGGITDIGTGLIKGERGRVLKGVGQTATGVLPVIPVGGAIAGAGVRQAITQGIKASAPIGGISAVANVLKEKGDRPLEELLPEVAKEGAIGTAIGGVLGGGLGATSALVSRGITKGVTKEGKEGIKAFLTRSDRQALADLGYTKSQIDKFKPEEGARIIEKNITPPKVKIKQPTKETPQYVQEMVKKQGQAAKAEKGNILDRLKNITREIDVKLQDFTTPINQAVNKAIKRGDVITPEQNPIYQIDRALRTDSIASQFLKDNGLSDVVGKLKNKTELEEFNQYLIARSLQEVRKERPRFRSGRDKKLDSKLVQDLTPKYGALAEQVFEYNKKVLEYARDTGIISKELFNSLVKKRTEYVPLKRVFNEVEENLSNLFPREVASLKKQSLVKRLKGSEREIANPLESILTNTSQAISQGERNIAARQIADLVKRGLIPGKILKKGQRFEKDEIISYLDNGERVNVFVGKDLARAAKYLKKEPLNFIFKVLSIPSRLLQVGAVGLNLPFVTSNLIRDQQTALLTTGSVGNTILNPIKFVRALYNVYSETGVYDDFLRAGAGFSSLDLTRDTAKTVKQLQREANPYKNAALTAVNPIDLFKAVEEFISKSEQVTRVQIFSNAKQKFLSQGFDEKNATILASDEARNATVNFARRGEWGTVLNAVIPFYNATIQGARNLRNNFTKDPFEATSRFALMVGMPIASTTAWNMADEERRKAYQMIPEYEKERNFIILPPVPTYDEKGYPFYIRIPQPQGYNQLANPIRKLMDNSFEVNPKGAADILNGLLGAGTGYQIPITEEAQRGMLSQFTPQLLKLPLETVMNKNLFRGSDIVPRNLQNLPPEEQVKEETSLTARRIGGVFGVSPLIVENTINTALAGLGSQLINVSDRIISGVTGETLQDGRVGGVDPIKATIEVFYRARGGEDVGKIYDNLKEIDQDKALLNLKVKDAILKGDNEVISKLTPELTEQQFKALERSVQEKEFVDSLSPTNKALFKEPEANLEALKLSRPDLAPNIDEVLNLKQTFKEEREKIDTSKLNFKGGRGKGGERIATIKTTKLKAKRPRGRRLKTPKVKVARIKRTKIRPIRIARTRTRRLRTPRL